MTFFRLSQKISNEVKRLLVERLNATGYIGDILSNPQNLKSTHKIDKIATEAILELLQNYNANIFIEGYGNKTKDNADFSIFIDPIDGSLNWDRGIGDPCIVIAISLKNKNIRFKDLEFAYVEGLRSGDIYYTEEKKSFFISKLTKKRTRIICKGVADVKEATIYLRLGYGSELAKNQIEQTFPLFFLCKDIRAIDNTGMEICEIARNAADLMVEARKASDLYNLLAYPVLKFAGGFLTNLDGSFLDNEIIDIYKQYDYIAVNNQILLKKAVNVMNDFTTAKKYEYENVKIEI